MLQFNGFAPYKICNFATLCKYRNVHRDSQFKLFPGDVLTEAEVMMLINAADKDGDGSLDFEEFVKIMM